MTQRMTTDVWCYYPAGGEELLLALALSDQAQDDGSMKIDNHSCLLDMSGLAPQRFAILMAQMQARGALKLTNKEHQLYQFTFRRHGEPYTRYESGG